MASFNFRSREPRDFMSSERHRQRAGLPPQPQQRGSESAPSLPPLDFQHSAPVDDNCWLASSYELRHGLQVSEESIDTLPAELRDAFETAPAAKDRRRGTR